MSADRDRPFPSSEGPQSEEETAEIDRDSASAGAAAAPAASPTSAPAPRATEVTTQIPATPAGPPRAPGAQTRTAAPGAFGGTRYEQPRAGAPPTPQQFVEPLANNRAAWPAAQSATPPNPVSASTGNHRAIDALSHVGVRSAARMPPQRGWRHLLFVLTRINVGLSPDEIYEMDLHARIRRNARDSYQIGVFGLKGGVGKTAVTLTLGSALSKVRGDRILAVDADPDGGNLADRAGRQSSATVADLLSDKDLSRYNDIRAYTSMNGSNLEVLSSEEYSGARRDFNDDDWKRTVGIVSRYYNLVLADGGSGLFHPASRGVLSTVSGLVIVASASIDGARQAAITMDWLRQNGYQDLLVRSCVVINHTVPGAPNIDVEHLVQQFERYLPPGRVIVLPWDKHVAAGTEIQLDLLSPPFRRRVIELAAALSDDFDRPEGR